VETVHLQRLHFQQYLNRHCIGTYACSRAGAPTHRSREHKQTPTLPTRGNAQPAPHRFHMLCSETVQACIQLPECREAGHVQSTYQPVGIGTVAELAEGCSAHIDTATTLSQSQNGGVVPFFSPSHIHTVLLRQNHQEEDAPKLSTTL
jgi:hypothetical protein